MASSIQLQFQKGQGDARVRGLSSPLCVPLAVQMKRASSQAGLEMVFSLPALSLSMKGEGELFRDRAAPLPALQNHLLVDVPTSGCTPEGYTMFSASSWDTARLHNCSLGPSIAHQQGVGLAKRSRWEKNASQRGRIPLCQFTVSARSSTKLSSWRESKEICLHLEIYFLTSSCLWGAVIILS